MLNDLLLTAFYLLCVYTILVVIWQSYRTQGFSFHLIFSSIYVVTFFGGFPLSMALKYGFAVSLQRPEMLFFALASAAVGYFIYFLSYHFFYRHKQYASHPLQGGRSQAYFTASLLALVAVAALSCFIVFNGLLLFRLEKYSQIFSPLVNAVALKRFFYFFLPALLIFYFISPSRARWWLFLLVGVGFGGLSYVAVGGTRANLALVVAFFLFIGWKARYLSNKSVVIMALSAVIAMFFLALVRYNLDVRGSEAFFTFLYLTRDTFSPWENFARILASEVEFQGLMPFVREFYVYIPQSLWADRPDIVWNSANYFTKVLLGNHSGLAISPTLLGGFYVIGGLPAMAFGMVLVAKLIAAFDRLWQVASPVWQGYLLANVFNLIVLVREGAEAFLSRWCFFSAVFIACWLVARALSGKRDG